ncbi:MAG TPA: hypothetical protein VLL97_12925 [Acidobacteriota bacterium]|nr:hypothetical protein [Acidobacteriota bacterium]
MNKKFAAPLAAVVIACFLPAAAYSSGKEFLTPAEIEKIQKSQTIDARITAYTDAAMLRLSSVEERLSGIESEYGDPFEFFSNEDMLDGYFRILTSIMHNLEAAFENPRQEPARVRRALNTLRDAAQKAEKELAELKRRAERDSNEALIVYLNRATDITRGAHEGAEEGLSRLRGTSSSPP